MARRPEHLQVLFTNSSRLSLIRNTRYALLISTLMGTSCCRWLSRRPTYRRKPCVFTATVSIWKRNPLSKRYPYRNKILIENGVLIETMSVSKTVSLSEQYPYRNNILIENGFFIGTISLSKTTSLSQRRPYEHDISPCRHGILHHHDNLIEIMSLTETIS